MDVLNKGRRNTYRLNGVKYFVCFALKMNREKENTEGKPTMIEQEIKSVFEVFLPEPMQPTNSYYNSLLLYYYKI